MKRGAEKQLSKDEDPDDEVEQVQSGFQIARESELAKREIKGLPKRRSPAILTGPPTTSAAPAGAVKFGSFAGFGAAGGVLSPFTFASSAQAAPAISESASNATKKFASFLGPSSTAGAKPVVSSETTRSDASGDTDEAALKYYTSLRGLNASFLSVVSKVIESDPFIDIADILEQYKKHRISVQQEYDGKSSQVATQSAPSLTKPSIPTASLSFSKPATSAFATMPVPPSSFAGFPAPSATPSFVTPASGFTPSPAASTVKPSPFSFPSAPPAFSDPKSASLAPTSSLSGFAAGAESSSLFKSSASFTQKEGEFTPSSKPAFSFGTPGPAVSSTTPFGNLPKVSTPFGSDKTVPEEKDNDDDKERESSFHLRLRHLAFPSRLSTEDREKEKDGKAAATTTTSSIFGGTFGSPAKSSPFTFGAAAAATPAPFGFGVTSSGSEGSPPPKAGSVGFSFGSPSHSPSQPTAPAPGLAFNFASTSASAPPSAAGSASTHLEIPSAAPRADTPATEGSQEDDGLARMLSPDIHGGEGEGEEDEETTYTVKAKVFKFTTDREGAPTWSEMGIGMLRLKKHKETNVRRVILRSSTTGKIIINFRIYPGLQPKRSAKTIAFTGHITLPGKDAQSVQYRLRVGTEATAVEMTEAIEREVRIIQAEAGPSI
ncbi:hypothetical protein B0F90DRAFT_1666544 [Multifurca ochricompacta]|uniref:RanBD1 domain-containing protein n=1 Tax=Multifurca ochricompacta TaxID=376703 RepID=A0AAD4QND1_9AGAM|nr:hypothetical protein B0F90DRAFT_1666544 [Multifurca ochricompacta]